MSHDPEKVFPSGGREAHEERLEELLRQVPKKRGPEALWARVARSLAPEVVLSRRLAWRRRFALRAAAAVAASVLLIAGTWLVVSQERSEQTRPEAIQVVQPPPPPPVELEPAVAAPSELDTLGEVHLVYEAGNFFDEDMVLVTAGEGYELW